MPATAALTHPFVGPPARRLATLVLAVCLLGTGAAAQAQSARAVPDGGMCVAERREIAARERALDACESQRASCLAQGERNAADLASARRAAEEANEAATSCQANREATCAALTELVGGFVQGRSPLPEVEGCLPAQAHGALANLGAAWAKNRETLERLQAFARGDLDAPPVMAPATRLPVEELVRRLAGTGREAPYVYRRLLVEAVRTVAPRFWRRLRASGHDASDAWFVSSAELDAAFVTEAQAALGPRSGADASAGPPQATALRFVRTFRDVAKCSARPQLRDCARAAQLEAFLESSSVLIVRRRLSEIWYTGCEAVGPKEVLGWLREFPSAQPSLGRAEWQEITRAGYDKLVSCYLAATDDEEATFGPWLSARLPKAEALTDRTLAHLDDLRHNWVPNGLEASCLGAVGTLRALATPEMCALPDGATRSLRGWFDRWRATEGGDESLSLRGCAAFVDAFWRGKRPRVLSSFEGPPSLEELVRVEREGGPKATVALRAMCHARAGSVTTFPSDLRAVAAVARAAGEDLAGDPWRIDGESDLPREAAGVRAASSPLSWAKHTFSGDGACGALGLPATRCGACTPGTAGSRYDCGLLAGVEARWRMWRQLLTTLGLALFGAVVALRWGVSMRRAQRHAGAWRREVVAHLGSIGLPVKSDPLALVDPSRLPIVRASLPGGPWERWGKSLVVTRAERPAELTERDVRDAAQAARAEDGELAIVTHEEGASPNLAAVRAMLDWAARGARRAVQVLPVSAERLRWARSTDDLLDLVEQVSLRGNPFEMRGRLVSSSQFFNRERLVSGLLAGAQAGAWTVITGLRRFGKSSLALEVARRLQMPSAYVDLAGFHHEVASAGDPSKSADAILRYVCRQLHDSASSLYGAAAALPAPPADGVPMDSDRLAAWVRDYLAACRAANRDRPVSPLVIFDEVEQAIGIGPERITHAIDVLSILVGRLRASLADTQATAAGDRIGVLFCSAIHVALWAPLTTLGRQSLLGAFPSVSVPRLPEDAAFAMMRGLGARQGIRFTEEALDLIVREAQGIPILVRRIGSSVLELYDPERARQGSLGAVEIGVEGAAAAVRREEEDGAPLRVWVESEIGDPHSPVGALLRLLARRGSVPVDELKTAAAEKTAEQLAAYGIGALLGADETRRRSLEAAGFIVRMLDEIGILEPIGDLTRPEAFQFPDSIVRRILGSDRSDSLLGF